jgi:hypothetical protein
MITLPSGTFPDRGIFPELLPVETLSRDDLPDRVGNSVRIRVEVGVKIE